MNEQTIQEQYQHIISLLQQKRLKEAQSLLETFLWDSSNWSLRNRLEQAQISYRYMLQYMKQGVNDPERPKLYRKLLAETWEIADQVWVHSMKYPAITTTPYVKTGKGCPKNMTLPPSGKSWSPFRTIWPYAG